MNAESLFYLRELIREKFDSTPDSWEASALIDRVRSLGIHLLDELADELEKDLKIGK